MLAHISTFMYATLHLTCLTMDDRDTSVIGEVFTDKHKLSITFHSIWVFRVSVSPL